MAGPCAVENKTVLMAIGESVRGLRRVIPERRGVQASGPRPMHSRDSEKRD
ncbi:MAG: hypothetical protein MZV70_13470 [Desulfobacterales bacterium]|nr:hypothetical protein [Desulfobacterales bacterium]